MEDDEAVDCDVEMVSVPERSEQVTADVWHGADIQSNDRHDQQEASKTCAKYKWKHRKQDTHFENCALQGIPKVGGGVFRQD